MNLDDIFEDHRKAIHFGLGKVDIEEFKSAIDLLCGTITSGGRIFVAGNGGSAAVSDHLVCDFFKGSSNQTINPQAISLVSNVALLTAIANDISFEEVFSFQLERYEPHDNYKDTAILISASGKSANIINAMAYCKFNGINVIGLTGFDGGALRTGSDVSLHIPVNQYGVVEDCHQAIMHCLAKGIRDTLGVKGND